MTERNRGYLTAGIDGEVVLNPEVKRCWPTGSSARSRRLPAIHAPGAAGDRRRRGRLDRHDRPLERPASTFRWVTAGDDPPYRITANGQLKPLKDDLHPHLGSRDFPEQPHTSTTRLTKTERVPHLSDSFTHPTDGLGLPAIARAAKADNNAAPATRGREPRPARDDRRPTPHHLNDRHRPVRPRRERDALSLAPGRQRLRGALRGPWDRGPRRKSDRAHPRR